jgi:serine/threonine protein kinase
MIDVYSLGNNMYALLHGLWVFYENEDDSVVQDKILSREKPFIDPQYYSTKSYSEQQLVEIIEACWTFDPSQRIDIFEVVSRLRHAVLVATNLTVE